MDNSDFRTSAQKIAAWQRADDHFATQIRTKPESQRSIDIAAIEAKTLRLRALRLAKEESDRKMALTLA